MSVCYRVVTEAREWRHYKQLCGLSTPMEEGMFSAQSTPDTPQILLRPKETVHIPFKYQSFQADHSVMPQVSQLDQGWHGDEGVDRWVLGIVMGYRDPVTPLINRRCQTVGDVSCLLQLTGVPSNPLTNRGCQMVGDVSCLLQLTGTQQPL